jgi:hypothetical protein
MLTKALLGMLTLELLSEIFSTVASIATPAWALQLFNVPVLPETIAAPDRANASPLSHATSGRVLRSLRPPFGAARRALTRRIT